MDRDRELEARRQIEQLNSDFNYHLDHNEVEPLVALFTEDAHYAHATRVTTGRESLRDLFGKRAAGAPRVARHLQTGLRIKFKSADEAEGYSVVLTYAGNGTPPFQNVTPTLVADFIDRYRRTEDGRWRISRREIHRMFEAPDTKPYGQ